MTNVYKRTQAELQDQRLKDSEHGTRRTYQRGCRCDACKAAMRIYNREMSERKRDKTSCSCGKGLPHKGHCRPMNDRLCWPYRKGDVAR